MENSLGEKLVYMVLGMRACGEVLLFEFTNTLH